jgi:hypothetical protein
VITEDVIASGGVFLDALSPYTPDQTAESLTQYAKLHGATWGKTRWAKAAWLDWPTAANRGSVASTTYGSTSTAPSVPASRRR